MEAYPNGAPFKMKGKRADREAAWSPKYEKPAGFIILNGRIVFIRTRSTHSEISDSEIR
jgi:hypothetical protein